ncbi:MAG: hypothetical protein JSV66_11555 [Trueperaceae bacterium]|nr:MAG: hypothetical protein JSV66_11555 [Trueperaceae bacterium]
MFVAIGLAQNRPVQLEIGFNGEIVADAWNPLLLITRDLGETVLEFRIDRGSLRDGIKTFTYRAVIPGGSGITVFQDDVFIPGWRSFVWSLKQDATTIASGSLGQRERDPRPLDLILSATPGVWRGRYGREARITEIAAASLPERLASYQGVKSLLIDGTGAVPRLESLTAAAAAGVLVVILNDLPSAHADLELLLTDGGVRLGAGAVIGANPELLTSLFSAALRDDESFYDALRSTATPELPAPLPQLILLIAIGVYAVMTTLLVRLAGVPGLVTALGLALVFSMAAWQLLRPPQAEYQTSVSLDLAAGNLAKRLQTTTVASLPEGLIDFEGNGRLANLRSYTATDKDLSFRLGRWQSETIFQRPTLVPALLGWEGETVRYRGSDRLRNVYVKGFGPQAELAAGDVLEPLHAEESTLPAAYLKLLPLLPEGSVIGRAGDRILALLPAEARLEEGGL